MTEETAKSPFLSGESFDELSVRRKAEPVATGAGALVSREAIAGDRFVSGNCIRCWMKAALFVFEQQYVSLCPKCATERIEHMASEGGELPPTVVWLHFETRKETRGQERQEREALSVKLDDFLRCHRCGRTVQVKDARYWMPSGECSSPAYCSVCRGVLAAGEDEPRKDRPWEREFEFPES